MRLFIRREILTATLTLAPLLAAMAASGAETLDPVHQKLIERIEAVRAEVRQSQMHNSGKIDAALADAISAIRAADSYYLSQHGGKFSPKAASEAAALDEDSPASEDAPERLLDTRDCLKDYLPHNWGGHVGEAEKALKKAVAEFRRATSAPKVAPVPTSARHAWWSTDYTHFLTAEGDETHRRMMWTYFFSGEELAHRFALSPDRWVPLIGVELTGGQHIPGEWSTKGKITLKGDDGPGVMFHEIFHTAFQKSVFRDSGEHDRKWNEGFCDAFRYVAEHELMRPPYSSWSAKIERLGGRSTAEAEKHRGNGWFVRYGYPAALIVKRSGGTLNGMLDLWRKLSAQRLQRGDGVLDQYFGWSPTKQQ